MGLEPESEDNISLKDLLLKLISVFVLDISLKSPRFKVAKFVGGFEMLLSTILRLLDSGPGFLDRTGLVFGVMTFSFLFSDDSTTSSFEGVSMFSSFSNDPDLTEGPGVVSSAAVVEESAFGDVSVVDDALAVVVITGGSDVSVPST